MVYFLLLGIIKIATILLQTRMKQMKAKLIKGSKSSCSITMQQDYNLDFFFLVDLNDAVKEGDGERLFKCLKIALLFFYKYKHTKYAYAVLLYICQVTAILSEYDAFHYLHNTFYNHKGNKGSNISPDLRMEQLNLICKTSLCCVGSNFTKNSAERISKSLSFIKEVIETVGNEHANM